MGNEIHLRYAPREGVTPEDEVHTLARVYDFVLRKHEEKKKGAQPGTPDDAKGYRFGRADRGSIS